MKTIEILIKEENARRLVDPANDAVYHLEAYLPFSEAAKLEPGNANVRPAKENLPFKEMMKTVEQTPEAFHLKNRGITYICNKFNYDGRTKKLSVTIPNIPKDKLDAEGMPRFGIADGGHTFKVITDVVKKESELRQEDEDWQEPYVRVHFLAGDSKVVGVEDVVEALNTSTQVKAYTLDEYRGKFDELKMALEASRFDINAVAFRENEDKEWQVTEIIQRMACFLKDRWKIIPPSSMYRSKDKALKLFIEDANDDFKKLFPIIREVITFPEFIQASLSEHLEGRRVGKVKGIKKTKKQYRRECTEYLSTYKMDTAIVLPMAAAFRTLLVLKGNTYKWRTNPYEVFKHCAGDLYEVLLSRVKRVKSVGQLAADQEYWISCEKVVMNARDEMS